MIKTTVLDDDFFDSKIPGAGRVIGYILGDDEFYNIPQTTMDAAMARGTAVHEAIEHFILTNGEFKTLSFEHQPYFEQFMIWYNKYQPEFLASELKILSEELGVKGVLDTVFLVGEDLVLCDFKTSSKVNMTKVTLQLNIYLMLLNASGLLGDKKITHLKTLKLGKTNYKYINIEVNENYAKSVITLYQMKKKLGE